MKNNLKITANRAVIPLLFTPLLQWLLLVSLFFTATLNAKNTAAIDQQSLRFGRLLETAQHQALQVAIVRYAPREGGNYYVDLVGAVHIGDAAYYQKLNQRFKQYDVVLFEAVTEDASELTATAEELQAVDSAARYKANSNPALSILGSLQLGMKDMLGLSFQMDEVDYTAKNFVHADMSPTEMSNSMSQRGESVLGMIFKAWRAGLQQSLNPNQQVSEFDLIRAFFAKDRTRQLKLLFAKELSNLDQSTAMLEGKEGSTIISERNKKALQVLQTEMLNGHRSYAIFYGAAHLKDMGQRLIDDFDMVPVAVEWLDAWDLDAQPLSD